MTGMLIVHCNVQVVEGGEDAFVAASLANAEASRQEPGVLVFDLSRSVDEPNRSVLVQPHYLTWRQDVADLMAQPRVTYKFHPYEG